MLYEFVALIRFAQLDLLSQESIKHLGGTPTEDAIDVSSLIVPLYHFDERKGHYFFIHRCVSHAYP